jgi:anthranilate/para-aminobenzoate synthase component I
VLRDDVSFVGILRAMFPGGSVTGAPKIRAMQIIEELEPVRRGPYCGAIGYLAPRGHMQFNVAIRTMIVKDGSVYIPVGGGIVADSDPAAEYDETLVKARAMFAALGLSLPSMTRDNSSYDHACDHAKAAASFRSRDSSIGARRPPDSRRVRAPL